MTYFIPYSYEMYGRVPVEASSLEEAKAKAREWVEKCSYQELDEHADFLDDSAEIDDLGVAKDETGRLLDM